ncbi:SIS domain-containing protein [Streptomyces sp. NPDC001770]
MTALDPEVMTGQVGRLAADLRAGVESLGRQADSVVGAGGLARTSPTVHLVGDGDSYHAACAMAPAFRSFAHVTATAAMALDFTEYQVPWLAADGRDRPVVVGISASGATPRVVQALIGAREKSALTVALTCAPDSPLARAAHHALIPELRDNERSPGIRTFQASLLGLLQLALRIAEARGHQTHGGTGTLDAELVALADGVDATAAALDPLCREIAPVVAGSPVILMTGSGPSYGTAQFCAAKFIEASGVFARGQDLEEWFHVERFARPHDMPVFVVAPPGRSSWRAAEVAERARRIGRRVFVVTHPDDTARVFKDDGVLLPVPVRVREEFSPLLYHLFADLLACRTAQLLDRTPFTQGG